MTTVLLTALLAGQATLSGTVRHEPRLEGGTWILRSEGKDYCLHGVPAGIRDGDRVELTGRLRADRACIHMVGPIVEIETIRKTEAKGPSACAAGPTGCDVCGSCVCRCRWKR